ncbi:MAG: 16S rRNA (adenine(1518)-N(6)/adenine(1519)-N(6))-dimethyltransferase RsmA [Dehalococcoidia bacterium]
MAGKKVPGSSHLAQAQNLLKQFGLRPKKGLGQHFLVDAEVLGHVVAAAELGPRDVVVEVGPGLGTLTRELAGVAAQVFAIELDTRMARALRQILAPLSNVSVVNADALALVPAELLADYPPSQFRYKVVANLPYYITSPVLRHFLAASPKPSLMVVMVQKEVAQAIVAPVGKVGVLGLIVQFYGRPRIETYVSGGSFYPVPKVDSAVLRIDVHEHPPVSVSDEEAFFQLIIAGFAAPRKQIRNSLALGLGLLAGEVADRLEGIGIASSRRPQTLTLGEWARVWEVFPKVIKSG